MFKLKQGNCLELMPMIPSGSVDMILCDLPYGTTACKWDTVIPFEPLWAEYKRIIKKNGAIVLFGSEPFSSHLRLSNIDWFKYDWTWVKSRKNGFVHAKGMPLRQTEIVSVFSQGSIRRDANDPMVYNPQDVEPFVKTRVNYVKTSSTNSGGHVIGTEYEQNGVGYPTNLITFKNESPKTQVHPTQKPVALCEYLVKTYTNEGEWVLDNCMGSGTTGVACVNTNRNFVGIEQETKYFEIAKNRIQEAANAK